MSDKGEINPIRELLVNGDESSAILDNKSEFLQSKTKSSPDRQLEISQPYFK